MLKGRFLRPFFGCGVLLVDKRQQNVLHICITWRVKMTSIRLSAKLEDKLNQIAEEENITKSEVIKLALLNFFKQYEHKLSAYELGRNLFGRYGSKSSDQSANYKEIIKNKLNEKHSH